MFFKKNKDSKEKQIVSFLKEIFQLSKPELLQVKASNQDEDTFDIFLPFVLDSTWPDIVSKLRSKFDDKHDFNKHYNVPIFSAKKPPVTNVKNIIAVSSGKGGVGKSACALNLALALKQEGARVGILDADIYGPSIPIMLGTLGEHPNSPDNKIMYPVQSHGLVSNSIGYLVDNDHASIWRGPMASKALNQLLTETQWPMLDYLIVDMPPGTGDIQLTMCQQLPLTAAVIVTTPQDIALSDAGKGIAMFDKLDIPVLGIVENMSYFECGHCHTKTAIFSEKGAQKLSEKYALPVLANIALDPIIRQYADNGKALIDDHPEHAISLEYKYAAREMSRLLCEESEVIPIAANMSQNIEITRLD